MVKNNFYHLLAEIGFDKTENGPSKICVAYTYARSWANANSGMRDLLQRRHGRVDGSTPSGRFHLPGKRSWLQGMGYVGKIKYLSGRMTCAENPPPSSLKQDGLCIHGLYCSNQSSGVEQRAGMCENVGASWFDTLKKRVEKKLPLDWKMAMLNIGSSF